MERDRLGDNLVPDYITSVKEDGFYGWPWYYMGDHQDPRHAGKHQELKGKVLVPDVLVSPHNASLGLTFYDGDVVEFFSPHAAGKDAIFVTALGRSGVGGRVTIDSSLITRRRPSA